MTTLPMISAQDGFQITVNDWLKDPTTIPIYVLNMMDQGFLADAVLRPGGSAVSGVVKYYQTTPLYADSNVVNRSEFGEVPVGSGSLGTPLTAFTVEKSMAVVVSDWMRRRESIDALGIKMAQVKNSIIRSWDDAFLQAVIGNSSVQTGAASAHWAISNTDIRSDILTGMKAIESATDANGSILGYECDTMIVNLVNKYDIIRSTQFNAEYYGGDIADQNLRYTGKLPQKIMGLNVLASPRVPSGTVIFLQSGASGFICDEVPLNATPMYRDEPRKTERCDITRQSAVGIDQPLSVYVLTSTT
jgi:hypothetical protein